METAGIFVSALPKLTAGVQIGQDQLHGRHLKLRVHIDRDAPAIVANRNGTIDVNRNFDFTAKTGKMFVDRVIQNFEDAVMQTTLIGIADKHAWPLPHRFQAFEFIDLGSVIFLIIGDAREPFFGQILHGRFVVGLKHKRRSNCEQKKIAEGSRGNNNFLVVSRQVFPLSIEDANAAKLSILWCQPFRGLSEKLEPRRGCESLSSDRF